MSSGIRRPKTAGPGGNFQRTDGAPQCGPAAAGAGRLPRRSGSQMSLRSTGDDANWPQYVPIRRVPSAMKRNMEIQTDVGLPPAMGAASTGQGTGGDQGLAPGGGALFYPYYVPGVQSGGAANGQQQQQQPFVILSPWQLSGYQNLPVLDPAQLRMLEPALSQSRAAAQQPHPLDGAPIFRSGRNGSCWRHVRQCTGNLGNTIMFIDGHVKEDDCRKFPPHGYPGAAGFGGLSVHSRLAAKTQPRNAAGLPLGSLGRSDVYRSQALERAKTGTKYWFEDRQQAPLIPNTIQGRIMKSGSAY